MRRHFIFSILVFAFAFANAQDVIVTTEGDSIECKITQISDDFIDFSVFDKSGILLLKSSLPLSKVKYYNRIETGVKDDTLRIVELKEEDRIILEDFEPASFRLTLNTGYTYQFGGYDGLPNSYKKQMQSLWNFGGELYYFLSENIGVGAKYNHIRTEANEDFVPPFNTVFGFSSLRDERIKFSYMGLAIAYRNFLYDDQVVNYFISGGIIKYRTDGFGDGVPFYQEGDTFGVAVGVSYDFILMKSFGLGFGAEINIARLSELDNNGAMVLADFSLTRVDVTMGIRLFK
ncbi:MAG: hypothetical protein ABJG47_18675 [Ekhidna sp.]